MSKAHSNKMGYKNPPVQHRFSANNQPSRRRKTPRAEDSSDFAQHLLKALDQMIDVTKKGKPTKVTAMEALTQQLIAKTLKGSASEQIKLLEFLKKSGHCDFAKARDELEQSHSQALAEKAAEYAEHMHYFAETVEMLKALMGHQRLVGEALLASQKKCSCGSFAGLKDLLVQAEEWLGDVDEEGSGDAAVDEAALNWTPGRSASDVPEEYGSPDDGIAPDNVKSFDIPKTSTGEDDDEEDPFYTGMINNKG